jgi:hypothetical protein
MGNGIPIHDGCHGNANTGAHVFLVVEALLRHPSRLRATLMSELREIRIMMLVIANIGCLVRLVSILWRL